MTAGSSIVRRLFLVLGFYQVYLQSPDASSVTRQLESLQSVSDAKRSSF